MTVTERRRESLKIAEQVQDKYVYFLLSVTLTAIGYIGIQMNKVENWWFFFPLSLLASSFYSGIKSREIVEDIEGKKIMLSFYADKCSEKQLDELFQLFESTLDKKRRYIKIQQYTLCFSCLLFIVLGAIC